MKLLVLGLCSCVIFVVVVVVFLGVFFSSHISTPKYQS